MHDTVDKLRGRCNYLASAQRKAIMFNCKHIPRLDQLMHDLVKYSNVLMASLYTFMKEIKVLYSLNVIPSAFISVRDC